jgi:ATP-binding cassette subfamily B protein
MSRTLRIRRRLRAVHLDLSLNERLGRVLRNSTDVSGGQWQRIALARALFSDAPVLILDEPTASLDPLSEAQLYSDFDTVIRHRTVLLVTHRLGAARLADRIAVMDRGRLVELGPHRDLVRANGLYAHMWRVQGEWAQQ